jgi:hypothetical protein
MHKREMVGVIELGAFVVFPWASSNANTNNCVMVVLIVVVENPNEAEPLMMSLQ